MSWLISFWIYGRQQTASFLFPFSCFYNYFVRHFVSHYFCSSLLASFRCYWIILFYYCDQMKNENYCIHRTRHFPFSVVAPSWALGAVVNHSRSVSLKIKQRTTETRWLNYLQEQNNVMVWVHRVRYRVVSIVGVR